MSLRKKVFNPLFHQGNFLVFVSWWPLLTGAHLSRFNSTHNSQIEKDVMAL